MKMLRAGLITTLVTLFSLSTYSIAQEEPESLYQYSVMRALLEGAYDGDLTVGELKKKGDFGIGTFNGLNGELVMIGDSVYRIKEDWSIEQVEDDERIPFAIATTFTPATNLVVDAADTLDTLTSLLDTVFNGGARICAVRIDGTIPYIKLRAISKQEKPYKRLTEVVESQKVYEIENTVGAIIGFRYPHYAGGINVPGWHFHFISADRSVGGHVLDVKVRGARVQADRKEKIEVDFSGLHSVGPLGKTPEGEITKVEREAK